MSNRYPEEVLDPNYDNGTMPESKEALAEAVVGHRIVSANREEVKSPGGWRYTQETLVLTLDNGKRVQLLDNSDCCAYTEVGSFLLNPELVDHVILGVGTTDEYETWHIYADAGDVLKMDVSWSCGNPFYYGYGFMVAVVDAGDEGGAS